MLKKVLKYDFKYMGRILIPIYLMTIGICLLTRLLYMGAEKFQILEILSFLTNITGLMLLIATIVLTFIMVIKRYYTTLFKEEGYLTNVLPVKLETHIFSKVISSLIFNILAILVFCVSFLIMYYSIELTEGISSFLDIVKQIIFYGIILLILTLESYEMLVFAAYSIGQMKNKNKILYSIIYGIGLYFIPQLITMLVAGITFILKPDYYVLLNESNIGAIKATLIIVNLIDVIGITIYYFITIHSLNKKMDLE